MHDYHNYIAKNYQTYMNEFDAFFENKSLQNCENYLDNLDELFFDHPKQLDLNYSQKKDENLDPTNFTQKQPAENPHSQRQFNLINVSKAATTEYIHAKKGIAKQTIELLPNFKTFIVRKIKDLLLIKVLSREQTHNCLNFMRNNPSFESLNSLLNPIERCEMLQNVLLELFTSSQIIRQIMQSKIRVEQKKKLIKFVDRIRKQILNPGIGGRWKQNG